MRKQRGFTLMEMLIVVAIIAILVAIAVPAFSASLEKSREAACAANRRSLKGLLSVAWMVEGGEGYDREDAAHRAEYTCPSGGEIVPDLNTETGRITVTCTVHDSSGSSSGSAGTMADGVGALKSAFQALCANNSTAALGSHRIDSTSPGERLSSLLEKLGMDSQTLSACQINSWCINNSANNVHQIYWAEADIASMSPGDSVTVFRFNMGGSYDQLFSVWTTKVESAVYDGGGTGQNAGTTYNRLATENMQEISESKSLSAGDKKDLDQVQAAYEAYLKSQEAGS